MASQWLVFSGPTPFLSPDCGLVSTTNRQSLDGTTLPASLQTLTFGNGFNQSLRGTTLPGSSQALTVGHDFDQCCDGGSSARAATKLDPVGEEV